MSTTACSVSTTTSQMHIRYSRVTSLTTVLLSSRTSGHHLELTSLGSQFFTKHAISTLPVRIVGISDTKSSTNCDLVSTARLRSLQLLILIRGFLFLWYLADRLERSTLLG